MPNSDEIQEFRIDVDRRLVSLEHDFKALMSRVDIAINTIHHQSIIIRTFEDERQRELGARGIVKYLIGLIGAGLMSIAYNLHDIINFFWPPKGH
jgi:hypothetical protein